MKKSRRGLHYLDQGSGRPLLWIHGFPLSGEIFAPQISIPGLRHIVPDLAGFGATQDIPPRLSMGDNAADLIDLLDELAIDKMIVAGLSMGGYIVFEIARRAPARIAAAVLIDTRETPDAETARKQRYELIARIPSEGSSIVIDEMLPKLVAPSTLAQNGDILSRIRSIMQTANAASIVAALQALAERPDSTDTLRHMKMPTLILVGAEDAITPPSDAERMFQLAPHAQLEVIDGGGHLVNMENPRPFNAAVEKFVGSLQ